MTIDRNLVYGDVILRFEELAFPATMQPFIHSIWSIDADDREGLLLPPQVVLPYACSELVLFYDDPFCCHLPNGTRSPCPRAILVGPQHGSLVVSFGQRTRTLSIRFRPGGLSAVFGIPEAFVAGDVIDVELISPKARQIVDRVLSADTFFEAQSILFRLLQASYDYGMPEALHQFVNVVLDSRGTIGVSDISTHIGWTVRRVQRTFRDLMGLTPKQFSRIVRLRSTIELMESAAVSVADIAVQAGYFDQSHLARDLKSLTGYTPERIAGLSPHLTLSNHMTFFDRPASSD